MNEFGFFCKSFSNDFSYLANLIQTFFERNQDGCKLMISLPKKDINEFRDKFGLSNLITLIADEEIYINEMNLPGWYQQQVVKLYSHKVIDFDNYLVLDSDMYFTRDFKVNDFYVSDGPNLYASILRTVYNKDDDNLHKYVFGNDHSIDFNLSFSEKISNPFDNLLLYENTAKLPIIDIENLLGDTIKRSIIAFEIFNSSKWLHYQPSQIFCKDVLFGFEKLLKDVNFSFEKLIKLCPWEYNWYGEFSVWKFHEHLNARVSPVLHFANDHDVESFRIKYFDKYDLFYRKFPLIQMASRHSNSFII